MFDTVALKIIARNLERCAQSCEKWAQRFSGSRNPHLQAMRERIIGKAEGYREARDHLYEICESVQS